MNPAPRETDDPEVADPDAIRAEWLDRLHALAAQVKAWVEPAGWRTRLAAKPTRDGPLGRFEVPLLLMERDAIQIALNPVSRFMGDSEGGVDLYDVPLYDEVAGLTLGMDGRWSLYYTAREDRPTRGFQIDPQPLSEHSVLSTMDAMARRIEQQI